MEATRHFNSLKNFEFKSSLYKKRLEEFKKAFEEAVTNDERMRIIQEMRDLSESLSLRKKEENEKSESEHTND
jgi:hypothetical protein